jgi:hypothetical protein
MLTRTQKKTITPGQKIKLGENVIAALHTYTSRNVHILTKAHKNLHTPGQKIKLGENVIAALRKMGCPSPLQPHQIRGLDFAALFPAFQWLVKHVLATREERGAQIRKFAELTFTASHGILCV